MSQQQKIIDCVVIRSAYSKKQKVQTHFTGVGRTKQSFKAECDINTIVSRFLRTGVLDFANKNQPRYGDTTGIEYQSAMQVVASAKTLFNELPAALRDRFENEPALFLDFIQDPRNRDEARELGLLKPESAAPEPSREGSGERRVDRGGLPAPSDEALAPGAMAPGAAVGGAQEIAPSSRKNKQGNS